MRPPMNRSSIALGLAVLGCVGCTRWIRLNVSPSVPLGLYRLTAVPAHLDHGMLVVLPVPRSVQHVWSSWVPLLKPIAGLAGDRVCHQENVLYVNGVSYGPVLREAHGRPLLHIGDGCQILPEGALFLASPMVRSLDSRYYGAVRMTDIAGVAFPIAIGR